MKTIFLLLMFYLMFSAIAFGQNKNDVLTMNDGKVYHGKLDSVNQYIVYFSEIKTAWFETYYEEHGFNKSLINFIELSDGKILNYKLEQNTNQNFDAKNSESFDSMAGSLQGLFIFQIIYFIGVVIAVLVTAVN